MLLGMKIETSISKLDLENHTLLSFCHATTLYLEFIAAY